MLKKSLNILMSLLVALVLVACGNGTKEVELPLLSGRSRTEIQMELTSLNIEFEILEEVNFNLQEGRFIRYGDGLAPGMKVDINETLVKVYVSTHKNILPDLTGLTEGQVINRLNPFDITIDIHYEESKELVPGRFIRYGGTINPGSEVANGTTVRVFISVAPTAKQAPLFISKYLNGQRGEANTNRALELFNNSDQDVNLKGYKINFYLNGNEGTPNNTYTFTNDKTLSSQETLLMVYPSAEATLLAKADLVTEELTFDGNDYIEVVDNYGTIIDVFGQKGIGIDFYVNKMYVRRDSVVKSNYEYEATEWTAYIANYYEILNSHPVETPTTFTYLDELIVNTRDEFIANPRSMILVEHISTTDGDTASFTKGFANDERIRFVGVNTPELSDPNPIIVAQAQAARTFLDQHLRNATEIYLQHDPAAGASETYNRTLALIWVDGELINYKLVLYGHSENMYGDAAEHFIYNGIPLTEWFRMAEAHAKANKLGIWAGN